MLFLPSFPTGLEAGGFFDMEIPVSVALVSMKATVGHQMNLVPGTFVEIIN